MVVSMKKAVFWVVVPCSLKAAFITRVIHPDNGDSKYL
jgi:hypothetical protein